MSDKARRGEDGLVVEHSAIRLEVERAARDLDPAHRLAAGREQTGEGADPLRVRPGRAADEDLAPGHQDVAAVHRSGPLERQDLAVGGLESGANCLHLAAAGRRAGTEEDRERRQAERGVFDEDGVRVVLERRQLSDLDPRLGQCGDIGRVLLAEARGVGRAPVLGAQAVDNAFAWGARDGVGEAVGPGDHGRGSVRDGRSGT